jgi:nitrile hydratase accessory protein
MEDTRSFLQTALPRDEGAPAFAEPWQAQAFALAVKLSEQGYFTWKEWATALAGELDAASRRGEPDDGSRYYEHWLAALEKLVTAKGLADPATLVTRKEAWASAYRNTPHGLPVELLRSAGALDARCLLLGAACAAVTFWLLQTGVEPSGGASRWIASHAPDAASVLPSLGFAASAGFGALLGMRHALEPDHLVAVSTLMTGERSSAKAAWLGAWWGLGHTLTLLTTGALLVVLRSEMPAVAAQVFELGVVMLLIGFGVRAIYQGSGPMRRRPTHTHGRPAAFAIAQTDRRTLARPFLVGAVHGLAGSGALTALVVTTLSSTAARLAYLTLFGVGSTAAMAALSGVLGWPIARLGVHHLFVRSVTAAVGGVSIALGLFWGYPFLTSRL